MKDRLYPTPILRPYQSDDEVEVLRLNDRAVSVLSPMNQARFAELRAMSSLLWVAELDSESVAFLMGFVDGTDYDSVNYRWFSARLKDFFYIDRIVVSDKAQSSGIGQRFYTEIAQWALQQQLNWLVAEVDVEPPNTPSLRFHDQQGFIEVGRQTVNGNKVVSLRIKNIRN